MYMCRLAPGRRSLVLIETGDDAAPVDTCMDAETSC